MKVTLCRHVVLAVLACSASGCRTPQPLLTHETTSRVPSKDTNMVARYEFYLRRGVEVRHGLYLSTRHSPDNGTVVSSLQGGYSHGQEMGLWVYSNPWMTMYTLYEGGVPTSLTIHNRDGNRISHCTLKDEKPYDGTLWRLLTGLRIKACEIAVFRRGSEVETYDCDLSGHPTLGEGAMKVDPTAGERLSGK
jgi:hypothetical protein